MDIATISTEVGKSILSEVGREFGTTDIRSLLFGEKGIISTNINKEFWIGNYRITIKSK